MKILITGAGGFVGKRLAAVLAEFGHEIVALVHSLPPDEDRKYFVSKRITTLEADLTTFALTGLPAGIEAIIALAQSVHFREFPERATEVFDVNVTTNLRLLDWAVRFGVRRFVLASSGGIYGGKLGVQFQETDAFPVSSPLGFYLGSKLCSEIVFQNYVHFFDSAVILRPFFIYGPGQREDMFVARLIKGVREGRPISLQGSHGLKVNPIFVDDAVKAFASALFLSGPHVVNVAGPEVLSLREIGDLIGGAVGRPPIYETREGEPIDFVGDITAASGKLGIPGVRFADGIVIASESSQ
jgi:UDP-glucose 4-epimerase